MILCYKGWLLLEPYEFELSDRDLREGCVQIIKDETGLTEDQAILVYENILRPNDLVKTFAELHEEDLKYHFKQEAYERFKEECDVEE